VQVAITGWMWSAKVIHLLFMSSFQEKWKHV
jgi:hypothetical protein